MNDLSIQDVKNDMMQILKDTLCLESEYYFLRIVPADTWAGPLSLSPDKDYCH